MRLPWLGLLNLPPALVSSDDFSSKVIADFGMAKVVTDSTLLQTFCGSLKYAAPELVFGHHRIRMDIRHFKSPQPPLTDKKERDSLGPEILRLG